MSPTVTRATGLSDVGRARERNEDAFFVGGHVFAVADGLGGHRAGEVASHAALEAIARLDAGDAKKAAHHIADAVRDGNRTVYERSHADAELKGMGTTMTAVAVHDGIAHLAHVGDSRCYLIRGEAITQLSSDHTLVARMVSEGKLTPEQAEAHPQRSILTRALGADRDVDVQQVNVALAAGDRLLLCSDGLTGPLTDEDIRALVSDGSDLDEICRHLIDEANARGGPDNITAVLVDVVEVPARAATRARAEREHRAPRARRIPVRPLVWLAIILALVGGGYLGVRTWANRSYYVGVDRGQVAIYRGLPVSAFGVDLSDVEETTDIDVERIVNPAIRRSLDDGIRASSVEDAHTIIDERIRPFLAEESPQPSPSSSPSRAP